MGEEEDVGGSVGGLMRELNGEGDCEMGESHLLYDVVRHG